MRIVVGEGSCGLAAGAGRVHEALAKLGADVGITGCIGMCYLEPIVDLYDGDALAARLVRVRDSDAERIAAAASSGEIFKSSTPERSPLFAALNTRSASFS